MAPIGPAKRAMLRVASVLVEGAMGLAARLPWKYGRYLSLASRADRLVDRGKGGRAAALARELLELAERFPHDWNYGNAIHKGHLILGRVALRAGDVATARAELSLAGQTSGSPQLDTLGPNMRLAKELLEAGETAAVLEYFDLCGKFWDGPDRLAEWRAAIESSQIPDFGPNLQY